MLKNVKSFLSSRAEQKRAVVCVRLMAPALPFPALDSAHAAGRRHIFSEFTFPELAHRECSVNVCLLNKCRTGMRK